MRSVLCVLKECEKTNPLNDAAGVFRQRLGVADSTLEDAGEERVFVLSVEGRDPTKHLVEEYSQGPPVNRETVRFVQNYLRWLLLNTVYYVKTWTDLTNGLIRSFIYFIQLFIIS